MIDRNKYNAEDFLIDNSFQLYCSGQDVNCINYWEKWILENPDKADTVAEAKRIYMLLSGNKPQLNYKVESLKQNIASNNRTVKLNLFLWLKVAAVVCLVAGAAFFFFKDGKQEKNQITTYSFKTKAGERKKVVLPDGSVVLLNAKSSLVLAKGFNNKLREVTLNGEAYFDVVHDKNKPFKVYTTDFNINVLGTSFNVKAYNDEVMSEATLIRGLITMESNNGNGGLITLKPSQKVTFYKKEEIKEQQSLAIIKPVKAKPEISINHYTLVKDSTIVETAWTQNRIEIYDQDFDQVREVLEKWYNVKISFASPELEAYRFTATFGNENIKQVLEALQKVENFKYDIKKNKIFISK